ncbi:hypothetical protein [Enterocloster phage PMBT24]|uniref:Uncharacterized protein n=1 Tax=Enterocloster phage PMBT24 TaxID=3025413 RepID=A0AAT9TRS6_9CAUD|nr:hypothetical protein [Enterocloster phage PMBT24]
MVHSYTYTSTQFYFIVYNHMSKNTPKTYAKCTIIYA